MDDLLSSLLQCFRKPARDLELMKVDNWFSITVGLARYLVKNASSIRSVFWILCAAMESSCKLRFGMRGVDLDAFEPPALKGMMR